MKTVLQSRMVARFRQSRVMRLATSVSIAGQLLGAGPVFAQDAARSTAKAATRIAADAQRTSAKARVRVNRTVPKVSSPSFAMTFGTDASTESLRKVPLFEEPLAPTGIPSADENRALAALINSLQTGDTQHRLLRIEQFLVANPATPWRSSLLANAAALFARSGYFSRGAAYWEQAWELTRDLTDRDGRAIADYTLAEATTQMALFGQVDRLERRLKEVEGRDIRGSAGTKVSAAADGLMVLTKYHHLALFSGPEALKALMRVTTEVPEASIRKINEYHPTPAGTSMLDLQGLAASTGMRMRIVHSAPLAEVPIPSIVHFRSQHFSAVTGKENGEYILHDPALGGSFRISEAALRDESTGYFLVDDAMSLPADWRDVPRGEATSVIGHCAPGGASTHDPPDPPCGDLGPGHDPAPPCEPPPNGMPRYSFHPVNAGLIVEDIPVGYTPPIGPAVSLRLSYNQRDGRQPQTPTYGNVGQLWTFTSLSYVSDKPYCILSPCSSASVYLRGQGKEGYSSLSTAHGISRAKLTRVSDDPPRYERALPDGTLEVFTQPDRPVTEFGRRTFLTELIDPQGNKLTYTDDSSMRLVAITDAIGQVTTLEYQHGSDPLLLTKATDPFGRMATIGYDAAGRIQAITDAVGMTSTFVYGADDFIVAMTTPYGTTTFRTAQAGTKFIEATDPAGGRERVEFHFQNSLPATEAPILVPTGFSGSNDKLNQSNSLYWDKVAMASYPDPAKATITVWMWYYDASEHHSMAHNVPHSVKRPLENRIWYTYTTSGGRSIGTSGRNPLMVGRVLDDGTSQVTQFTYNTNGHVTSHIDPAGRRTNYTYATNAIDLLQVEQVRSGGTDVLQVFANHNAQHLPSTVTDAAGQNTDITYNTVGQPLTVTNAKNETTTFVYNSDKYLQTVIGPVSGSATSFTYDGYGRVDAVEGSDGYIVRSAWDNLNRLTSRSYPDATTESYTYSKLNVSEVKDRLGRITRHIYDGFGRPTATRDPAGRMVSQVWCDCGTVEALMDAKGQRTTWERDAQGRVTREIRADGTTDTHYTYDLSGRLKTVTDPMDQVTTYTYNIDGSLASTGFTNEAIATPDISHTYDAYYPRPATMVDGNGTTVYTYVAPGTNGAGQLASVDGPFSNDTMVYTYDQLGRVLTRMLNGTGTEITYDALGRLSKLEFPIGAFHYTYVGNTGRRASVTYPNNQSTIYSYLDIEHDFRLQTIHHKNPSAATLSKFDYTYDTMGNITTWRQERAGSPAKIYTFGHDAVDQLTSAVLTDINSTPTILKRQAWSYDPAGNRTVDQTDDAVFATSHDAMNRLQSRVGGGPIVFEGSLNEPGTVTIDGKPATVDGANNFRGSAKLNGATTTVTVKAKDASGNETTQQYEVDASGSTTSYNYDANGNLTSDGTKTYYWNALNQLVEVKEGTITVATFEYDGKGRRTEKTAGGVARTYVYDAEDIIEERIAGSSSDTIRYYHGAGIDEPLARKNGSDVVTYYLDDHLGSIVQETNASGAVILDREYGPWGDLLSGASAAGYAFQGREWDTEIALYYFRARYYNAAAGAWASDDPIAFAGGPNFTQFLNNNPLRFVDPFGLCGEDQASPGTGGRYKSPREAGKEAVQNINPRSVKENREYAGMIYRNNKDGSYDYTEPRPGERSRSRFDPREVTSDKTLVGIYHTHGDDTWFFDDWKFSDRDKSVADRYDVPSYLGTPWDAVLEYDPRTEKVTTLVKGR